MSSYSNNDNDNRSSRYQSNNSNNPLQGIEVYGWKPDPSLSRDDNFMTLCMLVTRNSTLRQGSMACILVRSPAPNVFSKESSQESNKQDDKTLLDDIISIANNQPLYTENDSEVHAEIAALGQACRMGKVTEGCTAYITMPPCKRCFPALKVAGITRIVSRKEPLPQILQAAKIYGIICDKVLVPPRQLERINQQIKTYMEENNITNHNNKRKERITAYEDNNGTYECDDEEKFKKEKHDSNNDHP